MYTDLKLNISSSHILCQFLRSYYESTIFYDDNHLKFVVFSNKKVVGFLVKGFVFLTHFDLLIFNSISLTIFLRIL
jgi:hypothetical protein